MGTLTELAAKVGLALEQRIIPPNGDNVSRATLDHWYTITVHETDNTMPGADARFHNLFIREGGGVHGVSFTFSVDSERAVQNLDLNRVNYAQGTSVGNTTSVSVETCVNRDGNWEHTRWNLSRLLAILCEYGKLPVEAIVQHHYWYGKNCPRLLRATPELWTGVLRDVEIYLAKL